MKSIDNIITWC